MKMPRNTVYTRQGDPGNTRLADGRLVSKSHPRVVCLGELDELNSHIGLLRALLLRDFHDPLVHWKKSAGPFAGADKPFPGGRLQQL